MSALAEQLWLQGRGREVDHVVWPYWPFSSGFIILSDSGTKSIQVMKNGSYCLHHLPLTIISILQLHIILDSKLLQAFTAISHAKLLGSFARIK